MFLPGGDLSILNKKMRKCDYCGWDIDTIDLDALFEVHGECWKLYRRDGKLYPMPGNV
jgi:hypothetical protein